MLFFERIFFFKTTNNAKTNKPPNCCQLGSTSSTCPRDIFRQWICARDCTLPPTRTQLLADRGVVCFCIVRSFEKEDSLENLHCLVRLKSVPFNLLCGFFYLFFFFSERFFFFFSFFFTRKWLCVLVWIFLCRKFVRITTNVCVCLKLIIIIINPFTARVVGAPQMILQPVFSSFPCSPLPSGTCRTPGLSIPWCCLPTSSFVHIIIPPFFRPVHDFIYRKATAGLRTQKK